MYIIIASLIILFLFLGLRVHTLVLPSTVALVLYMRFGYCFIAWFPSIVLVGFLLAKVRPPTISSSKIALFACFICFFKGLYILLDLHLLI